ncbi:HSF-type DNA-binding-domain-containing protein [Calycina marina]|uniref:HSF-type DNA-binding-domain-containing protein n=1 Tax=Calycina marina TaxID=1763456 RepID=A0A9P7Z4E0_9HELO|nr:HSF-type DNA-binding-domain-containing protein [Calycina marina]
MSDPNHSQSAARTLPIIQPPTKHASAPSAGKPMEVSPPGTATMGPPSRNGEEDSNGIHERMGSGDQQHPASFAAPSAAAAGAASSQPHQKQIQTAFIHKLYNMLEDQSISHLISWSATADSFIMSPSAEFSKVLAQYFKHTNISSFVRQLNMYGFHKVSDVFHNGASDATMWEFKHGNGSFKRGDIASLRDIRRRASRHSLVHRDSYSTPKLPSSQPGTPAEPMSGMQESMESRLTSLEHTLYGMHERLQRSEDISSFLHVRNQIVMDALARSLQSNLEMSRVMLSLAPHQDTIINREVTTLQAEIQRQAEMIRSMDEPLETSFSSRPYFSNLSLDNAPVSPRQLPQDDLRRTPIMGVQPSRNNFHRPAVPSQLATPRRYGSIGAGTSQSSPSSLRPQIPLPPPPPHLHPQQSASSPPSNLSRRHTSADIRNEQGWQQQQNISPFASGQASTAWPSSPKRGPIADNHIRDSFSGYTLNQGPGRSDNSRPATPPSFSNGAMDHLNSWSWTGPRDKGPTGALRDSSGPPTRRGSMAHILNPAETAEREEEHEEELREDDRKRKRLQ